MKRLIRYKKGSAVFIVVIILSVVSAMLSLGTAKVSQAAMSSTTSNKTTLQAQSYAETEADILRFTNYDQLVGKSKSQISGTDFYREVTVSAESTYDSANNIKQKKCTVNVYKGSESIPRSSLKVIRLNKGETDVASVPQGTILPWYGKLSDIPSGFALCNGKNGTPNLLDRFLVGAGSSYSLGATGGEAKHTLTIAEMPSHTHDVYSGRYGSNIYSISCDGSSYGGTLQDLHRTQSAGGNQAHENRPPYYALYYIMKL